uniref:Heat shock protein 70 n=1 Tax=Cyanothece sp. (strain PCC 7425 / ATCC 29141) TaxID=395961 RepID=B8HXB0_CYAP4
MTTVAIDFGTSNTVVCLLDPLTNAPQTLDLAGISRSFETAMGKVSVVPSLVYIHRDGTVWVGEQVRSQRLEVAQPERCFRGFKRDLVAQYSPPARQIDQQTYTTARVCELFLQQIWERILQQGISPRKVILTVPVGAFEAYLDWFREYAEKLQIDQLQIVDESTAAALGYAVDRPGSVVLVVDFGGGTLDLSLVRTVASSQPNQILRADVLAKADAYVGGIDIDTWVVEDYLQTLGTSRSEIGEMGWQNLLELAERLKIQLSTHPQVRDSWLDDETFTAHEISLTQTGLADLLEEHQLLDQLRQALDEVLAIALNKGITKGAIEQVLLVGGTCQIPAIQQLIISYFGRQRVKLEKPFEAIAHGALTLGNQLRVNDYLHHGYAIRLWNPYEKAYTYYPLFEKGSKYPCQRSEPLVLQVAVEGQREIRLDIGEIAEVAQAEVMYDARGRMASKVVNKQSDFRSLESQHQPICIAHLNPPGQLGIDRIAVEFEVTNQRILVATVRDLLTQKVLVERESIARLS